MSEKRAIISENAPKAIGPYSQAIQVDRWLFISGQIPLNPASGEVVTGTIEDQTEQVMKNLAAIIAAAGLSFDNVVKTTVYLTEMKDFSKFNEIYAKFFTGKIPPARATVGVAALPRNVRIEIDAIAHLSG